LILELWHREWVDAAPSSVRREAALSIG
jgi:hypothetical protein